MAFLYNVHAPNKTFALAHKDGEQYSDLVKRIMSKAGLPGPQDTANGKGKDATAGVVYEYEGERWSLEDDEDLSILFSRYPRTSTHSVTLHITPAPNSHPHARFASTGPPAYTPASVLKNKTQQAHQSQSQGAPKKSPRSTVSGTTPSVSVPKAPKANGHSSLQKEGDGPPSISAPSHHFPHGSHLGHAPELSALSKPVKGETVQVVGHTGPETTKGRSVSGVSNSTTNKGANKASGTTGGSASATLAPPVPLGSQSAPSVRSTKSRRSKWGDDDAEPMWEVHKRAWNEFHNGNGVRTVLGKVGTKDNVRMLLKPGYKGVYVSRPFAVKAKLVDSKYSMGSSGYAGLCTLGKIAITVKGRTAHHQAMISEEAHFDVILGRQWVERMNVKIDPNDQTVLTYMDTGEVIPCDIVVLKDQQGNKIHIT